ncbi:unnamed protein product [Discosporangium mesarthrocarpum]
MHFCPYLGFWLNGRCSSRPGSCRGRHLILKRHTCIRQRKEVKMSASAAIKEPGVPAVTELEAFFTEVDGDFHRRRRDVQPITWKSSNTPIRKTFSLPIPIELRGTVVDYRFNTMENDIQFGVFFSSEGEKATEAVVELKRFDSHIDPVTGTFHLAHPGRLTLVWDNSYSWFNGKTLAYSVILHVPSILATETAKCVRAARALEEGMQVKHQSRARAEELTKEEVDVAASIKELEAKLEVLQAKLAGEEEHLMQLTKEKAEMKSSERLACRKIEGLGFRVMMTGTLRRTLSFAGPDDEWASVCRDWREAVLPPGTPRGSTSGGGSAEGNMP